MEDIGIDIDLIRWRTHSNFEDITAGQTSGISTQPSSTGVLGSFGKIVTSGGTVGLEPAVLIEGAYGSILDDLQVDFLIRATKAHRDSLSLAAPKVTVLSGESATFRTQRTIRFALLPNISTGFGLGGVGGTAGGGFGQLGGQQSSFSQNYGIIPTGTILNITPTITPDRKHVLLNITTELRKFLGYESTDIEVPNISGVAGVGAQPLQYTVNLPQTEISRVETRVSVPDGGTLLLGGQKVTVEEEMEVGVPVLSKIPIIGRMFDNRSKIKDQQILLILVKPTILLEEEKDAEAIAALEEGGF